jgi:hypothetical protein
MATVLAVRELVLAVIFNDVAHFSGRLCLYIQDSDQDILTIKPSSALAKVRCPSGSLASCFIVATFLDYERPALRFASVAD